MDDAALIRNTKIRLNGKMTLKDWTVKAVLTNLDAYTQEEGDKYLKTQLSPELRECVLQELIRSGKKCDNMEEFNRMKRSVFVLMNTRTYKLDLDVLMSSYTRNLNATWDFIEVLGMVSIAAPYVRHLKMDTSQITLCLNSIESRNASLKLLNAMKELRILEIVGIFNDEMDLLALLCRQLPNLRVLSVPDTFLECTTLSEEDIRLSFGHLRLLHIPFFTWVVTNKIWEVLPNLDILGYILLNGLTLEHFLEDENLPRERKYLYLNDHQLNVGGDFSSIKYLEIYCFDRGLDELEKNLKLPTTLDGLILNTIFSQDIVEAVLLKYGENLRWLSLRGHSHQSADLNRISQLCPKLEVLSMAHVRVTENAAKKANFRHLKELVTELVEMMNGSLTALLSSCPNLQKLKLEAKTCSLDDLQLIKNLILEKKILGSLQSLDWGIITSTTSGPIFKEIAAVMKNASATLPDLRKMKFAVNRIIPNINSTRNNWFIWPNYHGLKEAINADTNLFEILNFYK